MTGWGGGEERMESVIPLVAYLVVINQLHCFPVNCNSPQISMPGS